MIGSNIMQKQLDDIYKEIQECLLAGKDKHGNNNDDNDKMKRGIQ